jgi:nitroreductase
MQTTTGVADAMQQRRSIRWFDPEHKMSEEGFTRLMEYVLLSPTANNIQNWRFVRVTSPALREEIRQVAWNQAQVTEASELLIFCYNEKAWQESPERYWKNAPKEVSDYVLGNFAPYFTQPGIEREEGLRSCSMAAMSTMLLAKEMGYDSCPMGGFDFDAVGKLIGLPLNHRPAMMVAIGKKVKEPWPRAGQLALNEVLIENHFD